MSSQGLLFKNQKSLMTINRFLNLPTQQQNKSKELRVGIAVIRESISSISSSLVNEEITGRAIHCTFCTCNSISHTLIGQIKSHVQILLGRVWGRARAITRARMTRLIKRVIHTLPVSAAHAQSSKNNRFCRYYVIFGRNDRSALVGKIPVFMRKY